MRQRVADVSQRRRVGGGRGGGDGHSMRRQGPGSAMAHLAKTQTHTQTHARAHAQEQLVGQYGGQMLSAALQRTRR